MIKQTSLNSPNIEDRCSLCMYEMSLLDSAAVPGFADFVCKQGQGIYPSHWPLPFSLIKGNKVSHLHLPCKAELPITQSLQNCRTKLL